MFHAILPFGGLKTRVFPMPPTSFQAVFPYFFQGFLAQECPEAHVHGALLRFSSEDARSAYGPKIFSLALLFSSIVLLNNLKAQ